MNFLRFRLAHLFVLLLLVCSLMWATTQYGVEVAEIEILQYDTVAQPEPIADGYEIPQADLLRVSYKYLNPESLHHLKVHVFLRPALAQSNFAPGDRLKFRYRVQPVLWLKQSSPDQIALQKMSINDNLVEEMITESGSR